MGKRKVLEKINIEFKGKKDTGESIKDICNFVHLNLIDKTSKLMLMACTNNFDIPKYKYGKMIIEFKNYETIELNITNEESAEVEDYINFTIEGLLKVLKKQKKQKTFKLKSVSFQLNI